MNSAYTDSSVWITRFEGLPSYKKIINTRLNELARQGCIFCVSDAVLLEVMIKPYKTDNRPVISAYQNVFREIKVLKSFQNVFKDALTIARSENLNAMDAIHVAIAVRHKCKYFVSTDPHLKNLGIIQSFRIDLKDSSCCA